MAAQTSMFGGLSAASALTIIVPERSLTLQAAPLTTVAEAAALVREKTGFAHVHFADFDRCFFGAHDTDTAIKGSEVRAYSQWYKIPPQSAPEPAPEDPVLHIVTVEVTRREVCGCSGLNTEPPHTERDHKLILCCDKVEARAIAYHTVYEMWVRRDEVLARSMIDEDTDAPLWETPRSGRTPKHRACMRSFYFRLQQRRVKALEIYSPAGTYQLRGDGVKIKVSVAPVGFTKKGGVMLGFIRRRTPS